ncbi:MAG: hypothetical protein AAFY56_20780, partial [Pseudomonadota bacterium]
MKLQTINAIGAARRIRRAVNRSTVRSVIIHAGRMKTGSTFLQNALLENVENLNEHGWLFPKSLWQFAQYQIKDRVLRSTGHASIARISLNQFVERDTVNAFVKELEETTCERLILSAENIGRDARDQTIWNLAHAFDGIDTRIVMYLRRPSNWVNSIYVEKVTGGNARES